jgi:hypothetical protein
MRFKIFAPRQMMFASIILNDTLNKLGYKSELVDKIDPTDDAHIWIIYNASLAWAVPKYYICYQTEQIGTHWFNERYYQRLAECLAVWEYNEKNLECYQHLNNYISIVRPGVALQPKVKKDIDLLFYGALSDRRKRALKQFSNCMVVENNLGQSMQELLARTKVVVNIHYYNNSPLEFFRINECLSNHCNVVSEYSSYGDQLYKDIVRFGNINELHSLTQNFDDVNYDLSKFDNFEEIKTAVEKLQPIKLNKYKFVNKKIVMKITLDKKFYGQTAVFHGLNIKLDANTPQQYLEILADKMPHLVSVDYDVEVKKKHEPLAEPIQQPTTSTLSGPQKEEPTLSEALQKPTLKPRGRKPKMAK